jgi:ABC-2 type transport system ATP-binding protein
MSAAIETDNLTKFYGDHRAISNINLEVRVGEVFGYLGPNGSGKTTTIRTLLDFIRPTSGGASIFGLDVRANSREVKRRLAYLPGDIMLYEKLTGLEALTYTANLRGGVDWRFVEELAERLECDLTRKIGSLSRGNKQKVGLIKAFMSRPELIIMDEPSSGLDPLMQREFYRLIDEVKADGRTVFISSHIMPEVERVCDRVGIIRQGELVTVEDISDLRERALHQLEFHFSAPVPLEAFTGLPGVRDVAVNDSVLSCTTIGSPDALIKAVARYEVVKLVSQEAHLEDVFLSYYGEGENHDA